MPQLIPRRLRPGSGNTRLSPLPAMHFATRLQDVTSTLNPDHSPCPILRSIIPVLPSPPPKPCSTHVNGISVHSAGANSAPPAAGPVFVLVHGLGMSSRSMIPTPHLLAVAGEVHVIDLPGFGKSGQPRRALSISDLADALALWMQEREIASPVLTGNSPGAQVIADYAARHPRPSEQCRLSRPNH